MSFASQFDTFKDATRIAFNDKFMGNEGAQQLARFLNEHRRVEALEIKSNDISADGFVEIFKALRNNLSLKQLNVEYNNLGQNEFNDWEHPLSEVLRDCVKLERLNVSNNKVKGEQFKRIVTSVANSKSLRLLELRYNQIEGADIDYLTEELKQTKNDCLLYVELSGNKIKKESIDALEVLLKANRAKQPISKDKLMMPIISADRQPQGLNTFYKNNSIDDLSKENVLKHLEDILDQNRKDSAQMKVRLQRELEQLQKREKNDAKELLELDNKCNQMIIHNRNIKFELDRTISEHQQVERDQEHHARLHEEKLREANKELNQLQQKYESIHQRMHLEHQSKMREIVRDWEARLRTVEQKIRTVENQNTLLDNETKKQLEKKERLKIEYAQEEEHIRSRVEDEETQRYSFKLAALNISLKEAEESRERYIRRNQDLIYELEKTQANNMSEIKMLEEQLEALRNQEEQFVSKNKEFLLRNEKLKGEIQLKELGVQKLEEEANRLSQEIESKKMYNREQVEKILHDSSYSKAQREEEKQQQIKKLNQLEASLRNAQLDNAKLRQEYAILAQKLQVGLGRAVQDVFAQNSLY